jgi:hypothetical protein
VVRVVLVDDVLLRLPPKFPYWVLCTPLLVAVVRVRVLLREDDVLELRLPNEPERAPPKVPAEWAVELPFEMPRGPS